MKYFFFVLFSTLFWCSMSFAQTAEISIIPQPQSLKRLNGDFKLSRKTKIAATDDAGRRSAETLNNLLSKTYGFKMEFAAGGAPAQKNVVVFEPQSSVNQTGGAESYTLKISPQSVAISGGETGQFYAVQSLMQLLPVEFKTEAKLPAVEIADAPRFGYRGSMIDTGRHFMPVEFLKKHLDLMAQYKLNRFHWHLTDDQGWRIEIKKYPRLTEIASKRPESVKERMLNPYVGDGVPVEGFYTQEQIKDVIAYAKARHITTIPEIELPGHASAAIAAYPELGCKTDYTYKVKTTWGIFKEVFCPTDVTFRFLEDVLTETIALFPDSPYIHIGGDEVLKDHWKESAFVQELKRKENLKDEHEVQSYFIRRIERFINSKGKKIIGWDEILEGGVAPNATIMSWRGEKGGIESAKAKHDVIMTPNTYLYLDYGQGDPAYEPLNIGNFVPLEKVYSYDPHSKELTADEKKYILGAQGNLWTEYIKTPQKAEYMLYPRLIALAEVTWSPVEAKNYADFERRLQTHYQKLDKQNVNYRIPAPAGLQNVLTEAELVKIELRQPLANGKIYYTTDGGEPTPESAEYKKPFEVRLADGEKKEIKTIVVSPTNRKSSVYAATVMRRKPLTAVELNQKTAGVKLKFYKGEFQSVGDFERAAPVEAVETKSVMLPQFARKTNDFKEAFGARFDGFIYAPETAIYEFEIEADDGATLRIGDETVIDIGGQRAKVKKVGLVPLAAGYHRFQMRYFQADGDAVLNLRWGVKGKGLSRIYGSELFY